MTLTSSSISSSSSTNTDNPVTVSSSSTTTSSSSNSPSILSSSSLLSSAAAPTTVSILGAANTVSSAVVPNNASSSSTTTTNTTTNAITAVASQPWSFYSLGALLTDEYLSTTEFFSQHHTPNYQIRLLISLLALKRLPLAQMGQRFDDIMRMLRNCHFARDMMMDEEAMSNGDSNNQREEEDTMQVDQEDDSTNHTTATNNNDTNRATSTAADSSSTDDLDVTNEWLIVMAHILEPYYKQQTLNANLKMRDFREQIEKVLQEVPRRNLDTDATASTTNQTTSSDDLSQNFFLSESHSIFLNDGGMEDNPETPHCKFQTSADMLKSPSSFLDAQLASQQQQQQKRSLQQHAKRNERIHQARPSSLLSRPGSVGPRPRVGTPSSVTTPTSAMFSSSAETRRTTAPMPTRPHHAQKKRTTKLLDTRPTKKPKLIHKPPQMGTKKMAQTKQLSSPRNAPSQSQKRPTFGGSVGSPGAGPGPGTPTTIPANLTMQHSGLTMHSSNNSPRSYHSTFSLTNPSASQALQPNPILLAAQQAAANKNKQDKSSNGGSSSDGGSKGDGSTNS